MRRLLRWATSAICLLSLLACLATAWLWWHTRRVKTDAAVMALGPTKALDLFSKDAGLGVMVSRGGPPMFPVGVRSYATDEEMAEDYPATGNDLKDLADVRRLGCRYRAWSVSLFTDPDRTRALRDAEFWAPAGSPLTRVQLSAVVVTVPHGEAFALFALPPFLWLLVRSRRAWRLRRRRRLGRCLRCGYDLRGNASGRCPECGESVRPVPSDPVSPHAGSFGPGFPPPPEAVQSSVRGEGNQ